MLKAVLNEAWKLAPFRVAVVHLYRKQLVVNLAFVGKQKINLNVISMFVVVITEIKV